MEPEDIPIGDKYMTALVQGEAARGGEAGRRRIETSHAVLHLGSTALEQDWPDGSLHRIVWESPFEFEARREDLDNAPDLVDLHVRLVQTLQVGQRHTVAFTLRVSTASVPDFERESAILPLIEGKEAMEILSLLGRHASDWPV